MTYDSEHINQCNEVSFLAKRIFAKVETAYYYTRASLEFFWKEKPASCKSSRECARADCGNGNAKLVQLQPSKCPPLRWVRGQRSRLRPHLPRDRGVVWGGGHESEDI